MASIIAGDCLDLIRSRDYESLDLVVTDPPYAFGGEGEEHAISATVAVALREAAQRLRTGSWMLVFCASSWRSLAYVVEATRPLLTPVRVGCWTKPAARTRVRTAGWSWATVPVIALRKGRKSRPEIAAADLLDHITCAPVMNGRRAQLPDPVADWAVRPFAVAGGLFLDLFAGSGALPAAAERAGMRAAGFEASP